MTEKKRLQYTPSGMGFTAPAKQIVYQNSLIALVDKRGLPKGTSGNKGEKIDAPRAPNLSGIAGTPNVSGVGGKVPDATGVPGMAGMIGGGVPYGGVNGVPMAYGPGVAGPAGVAGQPYGGINTVPGMYGVAGQPYGGINAMPGSSGVAGVYGGVNQMTPGMPGSYGGAPGVYAPGLPGGVGMPGMTNPYGVAGFSAPTGAIMQSGVPWSVGATGVPGGIGHGGVPGSVGGAGLTGIPGYQSAGYTPCTVGMNAAYGIPGVRGGPELIARPYAAGSPQICRVTSPYANPVALNTLANSGLGSPYKRLTNTYPGVSFTSRMSNYVPHEEINVENCSPRPCSVMTTPRDWSAHATETMDFLRTMWRDGKMCDVILQVCGMSLPAHRVAIAAHSDKYSHHFKSLQNTALVEIILSKTTPEATKNVLSYIYTGVIEINDNIIDAVVGCAKELGITKIENLCKDYLFTVSIHKAFFYLEIAEKHDLNDAMSAIRRFIRRHFKEISHTPNFVYVDSARLHRLLADDTLVVGSELDVFFAILRWIDFDRDVRICFAAELIRLVRFNHVSPEEIVAQVEPIQYIFQIPECKDILYSAFRFHALKSIGSILADSSPEPLTRHMIYSPEYVVQQSVATNQNNTSGVVEGNIDLFLQQLASVHPDLANIVPNIPEMARILIENPDLCNQIAGNVDFLRLLAANPQLGRQIALTPDLTRVIAGIPSLARLIACDPVLANQIVLNSDLATVIATNPDLIMAITDNPDIVRALINNPELIRNMVVNPDLAKLISGSPDILRIIEDNSEIMRILVSNPEFPRILAENPDLVRMMANKDFIRRICTVQGFLQNLITNPDLAMRSADASLSSRSKVMPCSLPFKHSCRVYTLPTSATTMYRS